MMPRQIAATEDIAVSEGPYLEKKAPDAGQALFLFRIRLKANQYYLFRCSVSPIGNLLRVRASLVKDIEVNLLDR